MLRVIFGRSLHEFAAEKQTLSRLLLLFSEETTKCKLSFKGSYISLPIDYGHKTLRFSELDAASLIAFRRFLFLSFKRTSYCIYLNFSLLVRFMSFSL